MRPSFQKLAPFIILCVFAIGCVVEEIRAAKDAYVKSTSSRQFFVIITNIAHPSPKLVKKLLNFTLNTPEIPKTPFSSQKSEWFTERLSICVLMSSLCLNLLCVLPVKVMLFTSPSACFSSSLLMWEPTTALTTGGSHWYYWNKCYHSGQRRVPPPLQEWQEEVWSFEMTAALEHNFLTCSLRHLRHNAAVLMKLDKCFRHRNRSDGLSKMKQIIHQISSQQHTFQEEMTDQMLFLLQHLVVIIWNFQKLIISQ